MLKARVSFDSLLSLIQARCNRIFVFVHHLDGTIHLGRIKLITVTYWHRDGVGA
jgi:hypothetical protein